MNFWHRWIGSIQKKTAHLSLAEMGAYDRLLDHYYAQEHALPADAERCYRIAGAATKDERKAVDAVLSEFFELTGEGYSQERADKEIAIAEPRLTASRLNGSKGGRPKKSPAETQKKPSGFPRRTQSESSTTTTTKNTPPSPSGMSPPEGVDAQVWADWLALRKAKRAPVTATVVASATKEAGKAGMGLEDFLRVWCARGSQGLQADWLQPAEKRVNGHHEPDWRREQRERTQAFAGHASAQSATIIDAEEVNVARLVG